MELVLEQTQQGTSYEVSVSAEEVEELKRKVKINGEKKEALLKLRQKPGQYICCQESQRRLLALKTNIMDPNIKVILKFTHIVLSALRRSGIMAGVDVDTITMEQYLALSQENQAPSVVKPEIKGNVNFEIKSQFMRELREYTFSGNKDEDAHDHIDRVLSIVGLFNIPGVSKDAVML
ncbi:hypothetical protein Tco_0573424 [Tanacetum coccineum]